MLIACVGYAGYNAPINGIALKFNDVMGGNERAKVFINS